MRWSITRVWGGRNRKVSSRQWISDETTQRDEPVLVPFADPRAQSAAYTTNPGHSTNRPANPARGRRTIQKTRSDKGGRTRRKRGHWAVKRRMAKGARRTWSLVSRARTEGQETEARGMSIDFLAVCPFQTSFQGVGLSAHIATTDRLGNPSPEDIGIIIMITTMENLAASTAAQVMRSSQTSMMLNLEVRVDLSRRHERLVLGEVVLADIPNRYVARSVVVCGSSCFGRYLDSGDSSCSNDSKQSWLVWRESSS